MQTRDVTIINRLGLHARAASKFVSTAQRFGSEMRVKGPAADANAKSIMSLMLLAASQGTQLTIETEGEDEVDAMDAIVELIANRFDESE